MKNISFFLTLTLLAILTCFSAQAQEVVASFDWTDNGGTITSQFSDAESLTNLFDNNPETIYVLNGNTQNWFQYESPVSLGITAYTVVSGKVNSQDDPRDWEFQVSDDGTNWTTVRTETAQAFGYRLMQKNYLGYNGAIVPHKFFRLKVNANNGGSNLQIAELQLFGYPEVLEADLTNNGGVLTAQHAGFTGETFVNATNDKIIGSGTKYTITGQRSAWLQYESPSAFVIKKYSITTPCCNWDRNPRSWQLLGSNDGSSWKVIDTRINKTFIATSTVAAPYNMQVYSLPGTVTPAMDWGSYADTAQAVLKKQYWNGTYYTQDNNTPPHTGFNYWWHAHAIDVLVDAYNRTHDNKYITQMDAVLAGMLQKNGWAQGSLYNWFFDDMEWMGLACLRAYYATNDEKWKNHAVQLWNWTKQGWNDTTAGGGIIWSREPGKQGKNAISNTPAVILSARLYKLTQEQEYLDWSKKIYEWVRDSLVDASRGVVWDGYGSRGDDSKLYNYNQGVYIGAGVELYSITNDPYYLDEAKKTASYVVNDRTRFSPRGVLQGHGTGDGGLFKGITMRYLSQLILNGNLDEPTRLSYLQYFHETGKNLWNTATLKPNIIFGPDGINRHSSTVISCSNHLSGIMIFELLDELQRSGFTAEKYYQQINLNAQKAYRFFRLDIIGNTANSDLHMAEWQLFGTEPDPQLITITSPTSGSEIPFGTTNVQISADVSGFPGVSQVSFYDGATLIGTDSESPYSIVWSDPTSGVHSLTAKATDDDNVTIASAPVEITVEFDPGTQSVKITSPENHSIFLLPSSITINAEVTALLGVTDVSFYRGSTLIGADTESPYSFTWNNPPSGVYKITAKATSDKKTLTSTPVEVIVSAFPNPTTPSVVIVSPASGASHNPAEPVTIAAEALVAGATQVSFYNGKTLIGLDTEPPYSITWTPPAGIYYITAKTTNEQNESLTSVPIQLKVSNIVTGVAERPDDQVGPYPNPFTSSVFIPVSLKSHGPATVIVYNSSGQVIHRSDYDELDAGDHHLEWKPMGENIHEGLFSYMTLTNDGMKTGKIMWTR